jgi:hypothetical protein
MKRMLLALLITPTCYCNTIIKESFLRKILCIIFPYTRSKEIVNSIDNLLRIPTPTPSIRKRYSGLNLSGCTPITKEFKDYVKSRHLQVPANE